jgi:hypothetical protein
MFRRLHVSFALAALFTAASPVAGQTTELAIKALDQRGRVLSGIRFAFAGVESLPTTDAGVTGLAVPEMAAGEAVKLDLPGSVAEEWLLVDSSRTCAVFLGPKGLGPWHSAEMRVALGQRVEKEPKRVIPVLLPGADASAIPDFLAQRTWVDFRAGLDDEAAFSRLVAGIRGVAPSAGSQPIPEVGNAEITVAATPLQSESESE